MSTLMDFASNIANGQTKVVDLTHTLDPDFPVIILPPEFGQCARLHGWHLGTNLLQDFGVSGKEPIV